ncbi:MAG: hypothetical protein FWH51_02430 [Dehalococcoidia bacterium]|nr:hypothetical protein [Dehalococcoidia bacterium]
MKALAVGLLSVVLVTFVVGLGVGVSARSNSDSYDGSGVYDDGHAICAEGPNDKTGTDSGRVWSAYQFIDGTDGTVPLVWNYEAAEWWNENMAGKPISDEEWEALQQLEAQAEAMSANLTVPIPTLTDLSGIVIIDIGDNT